MKQRTDYRTITDQQREKLPVYVREYIEMLERQRDEARDKLAAVVDNETESNVWYRDMEGNRFYINGTERLTIRSRCGRVHLGVTNYDDHIQLSWSGGGDEYGLGDVCFIPTSYQQARIVHPANASVR